ncbi:hypothetical protein HOLleu_20083 [Holothuria leucospilota]|uniref:Uncharacterized protein n=1 Tax=Holothuria leucospilota TaxID=206669 RepID=A0A9Q1C0X4_HOLLE|nr:hypothetical protein HOLleu_20083 [Holothuria leucospilota]
MRQPSKRYALWFTSRLDNCNNLLIQTNKSLITRLQNVQHASACIILNRKKCYHITLDHNRTRCSSRTSRTSSDVHSVSYIIANLFFVSLMQKPSLRQLRSSTSSFQYIEPKANSVTFVEGYFSCFRPKE